MRLLLAGLVLIAGCGTQQPQPAAVELPSTNDRSGWRKHLNWSKDCEDAFQATGAGRPGIQSFDLGDNRKLVEVACASGAYQGSQEYFLLDGSKAQPLTFTTLEDSKLRDAKEITGLADFDKASLVLKVHNRYRGPGDCGSYAVYAFTGTGAQVKELREKAECDGEGAEHPEQWPLRK